MSETHSTTENNNSHCCDNTCGNADDRVVPDSVEINPLFARPKEAQAFSKFTIPQRVVCRKPPTKWCMTRPCWMATRDSILQLL